jgi:imidazolonepropionase-like amidohydrolase
MDYKLSVVSTWISFLVFFANQAQAEVTILQFSQLIDGNGVLLAAREIAVSDVEIVAVGGNLSANYPEASIIDLKTLIGLPGLIDVHTHITYALAEPSKGDAWSELTDTSAAERVKSAGIMARRTLETGVTSVRNLGSWEGTAFTLRDQINEGVVTGPRLFLSGRPVYSEVTVSGGESTKKDIISELTQMTRVRVTEGADWIKLFASNDGASDLTGKQVLFYPEIKAVVDVAHAVGVRVALHTYGPDAVRDALRAGVDSIEHPVGLDDKTLKEWSTTNIFYVPTIDHNRYYADYQTEFGYDEDIERNLREFVQANLETVRRAHAAGIRIAMGSDAVFTMFGQNTRELEWFVEAGMSNAEALTAAIKNGAELLGMQTRLGRLAPGFYADIIGVEGNPLEDIKAIVSGVVWVMKDGRVVGETTGSD